MASAANERNTRQRKIIQEVFSKECRPLSPQEVLLLAQEDLPGLGIATVYRTIRKLQEDLTLASVDLPGSTQRYEIRQDHHHHHFHCRNCDRVFELPSCGLELSVMIPKGFLAESHDLTIQGLCRDCKGPKKN